MARGQGLSLDVSVPVQVDGVGVDASTAPILFSIPVGGYCPPAAGLRIRRSIRL